MKSKSFMSLIAVLAVGAGAAAGGYYISQGDTSGLRILHVDSYHQGYAWSDGISAGIEQVLASANVAFKVHRMDTKRQKSDEAKKQAALEAKAVIEEFKPDVVIATDDNAQKYLVVPYYRGKDLPFVFAGVNWDASRYGFPASNVTGMVEVNASQALFDTLRSLSGGNTVGFLGDDTNSTRKELSVYKDKLDLEFEAVALVSNFEAWKQAYIEMQDKVDILYFYNNAGIEGWNDAEASRFVLEHAKIPSGAVQAWMGPYVLLLFTKDANEQGEWAATTALQILQGISPSQIPIAKNRRVVPFVNSQMAQQLQVEIPSELMQGGPAIF